MTISQSFTLGWHYGARGIASREMSAREIEMRISPTVKARAFQEGYIDGIAGDGFRLNFAKLGYGERKV